MLTALVELTAPVTDGVDDGGDETRVGEARFRFELVLKPNPTETAVPPCPR